MDKKLSLQVRENEGKRECFCVVRKRWIVLSSEEWVRQHVLLWLHEQKHFILSRFQLEYPLTYSGRSKRADAVYFDRQGKPYMLIELKSAETILTQKVMDQAAVYNTQLKAPILLVSNGASMLAAEIDSDGQCRFLNQIPDQAE